MALKGRAAGGEAGGELASEPAIAENVIQLLELHKQCASDVLRKSSDTGISFLMCDGVGYSVHLPRIAVSELALSTNEPSAMKPREHVCATRTIAVQG